MGNAPSTSTSTTSHNSHHNDSAGNTNSTHANAGSSGSNGGGSVHAAKKTSSRRASSSKSKKSSAAPEGLNHHHASTANTSSNSNNNSEPMVARASKVVGDFQAGLVQGIRKLEEQDHPAAALLDSMCGPYLDPNNHHNSSSSNNNNKHRHVPSSYSEEMDNSDEDDDEEEEEEEEDSRTVSEEETTVTTDYHRPRKNPTSRRRMNAAQPNKDETTTVDSRSYVSDNSTTPPPPSHSQYHHHTKALLSSSAIASASAPLSTRHRNNHSRRREESSYDDTEEDDEDTFTASRVTTATSAEDDDDDDDDGTEGNPRPTSHKKVIPTNAAKAIASLSKQPLASSFAKRCYFTKSGIGGHTQHYEGLTLTTGNVILMLASAMKLKGCPTICDEDLRRVEQTYPNQFSRLPDELLLSSGWRRISKYCHFSNKPIPDGIPFFHSRQRLHPSGGYYFLLASAVGMVRPIDVEPLTRDTLVLLETDYPTQCDMAPTILIQDPDEWTVVDKFCFFSGGPINTDEDVYYMADFDGNPIYMLAFLSPSLTPSELYKLNDNEQPLRSIAAVEEVESVYDLTERDFDDLKLYHLGPCRALPQYILQPMAWTKVLPPHFLAAREAALIRAHQYEEENGILSSPPLLQQHQQYPTMMQPPPPPPPQTYMDDDPAFYPDNHHPPYDNSITTATSNTMRYIPSNNNSNINNSYGPQSHPVYGAIQQQHHYGPHQSIDASSPNMFSGGNYGHTQPYSGLDSMYSPNMMHASDHNFLRNVAEEGAFIDGTVPIDEAIATQHRSGGYHLPVRPPMGGMSHNINNNNANSGGIDPPEDEPPSLRKRGGVGVAYHGVGGSQLSVSSADPSMTSPQYESSPLNNNIDDEPISPPFETSPSDFFDDPENNDAMRYGNENFHDVDRNPFYPTESGNVRYQNIETLQQPRYDPRYDTDEQDGYDRSPEFAPDDKFDEHGTYQYDDTPTYGNEKFYGDEFGVASPQQYQPSDQIRNTNPDIYPPRDDDEYEDENIDNFGDITPQPSGVPFSDPGDDIGYDDNGFPLEKEPVTSQRSESEYSAPTMNDDGFSNGLLYMSTSTDDNIEAPLETTRRGNMSSQQPQHNSTDVVHHFPPVSPRSGHGSEFSQSSAMRGAQELLRRNRQKRLELAMRMKQQVRQYNEHEETNDTATDENEQKGGANHMLNTNDVTSPQSQDSGSTWQTGVSEYTGSEVTGGSSIWTDTENNPDRSSRRALILQMARARMKNQGGTTKQQQANSDSLINHNTLEEKKLEHIQEVSNDVDFAVDLD